MLVSLAQRRHRYRAVDSQRDRRLTIAQIVPESHGNVTAMSSDVQSRPRCGGFAEIAGWRLHHGAKAIRILDADALTVGLDEPAMTEVLKNAVHRFP